MRNGCRTDLDRDVDRHRYLDSSRVSVGKGALKIAATQADCFAGPSAAMQVRHVWRRRYPSWHFPQQPDTGTPSTPGFLPPLLPICRLQKRFIQCALRSVLWDLCRQGA